MRIVKRCLSFTFEKNVYIFVEFNFIKQTQYAQNYTHTQEICKAEKSSKKTNSDRMGYDISSDYSQHRTGIIKDNE